MKTLTMALLALVFALGGCQFLTPPPEVRVSDVDPVNQLVDRNSGGTYIPDVSVSLEITNNVEAVLKGFQVGYYDVDGENSVASRGALIPFNIEFSAVLNLGGLDVQISQELIDYMYDNSTNAVIKLFFTGEDAYGYDLEFDADTEIPVYALDF